MSPPRLSDVRIGLAEAAGMISGLNAYPTWPDTIQHPAVIPVPSEGTFHDSLGTGMHMTLDILLLIAPYEWGLAGGQELTDPYLDAEGDLSVKAAVEADTTLGGIASAVMVHGWTDYGPIQISEGVRYWGARLPVEVWF